MEPNLIEVYPSKALLKSSLIREIVNDPKAKFVVNLQNNRLTILREPVSKYKCSVVFDVRPDKEYSLPLDQASLMIDLSRHLTFNPTLKLIVRLYHTSSVIAMFNYNAEHTTREDFLKMFADFLK